MNSFLFSAITICLAAQCALAQYNTNSQYQRKMAPAPAAYGQQASGYGSEAGYGNAAATSSYDERSTGYGQQRSAGGYGRQTAAASGYGQQQAASGYGQQAASGYAKAAPRYEESYSAPMPFAWGYDINDGYGGAQYHKENGDEYGKRTGSYGYTDAYGVYRQVDYVADEHGFRATIKTNEPGTSNESPADVEMHAYEPPSNYYAGNRDSGYSAGKGAAGYAQQQQQTSSYAAPAVVATYAPAAGSYNQPRGGSNYQQQQQQRAGYQRQTGGYQQQQQAEQYSGSSVVPVYQKAALGKPLAAAPAKRY